MVAAESRGNERMAKNVDFMIGLPMPDFYM